MGAAPVHGTPRRDVVAPLAIPAVGPCPKLAVLSRQGWGGVSTPSLPREEQMRGLLLAAAAALALPAGGALAAPQIKQPECSPLEAWGTQANAENYSVAPRLDLPKALEDAQVVPLFGVGVLVWTQEDLQAANQLLVKCYGEAGKRHD